MGAVRHPLETAENLLISAERCARLGQDQESTQLIAEALADARTALQSRGYVFSGCREWQLFEAACELPHAGEGGLLVRLRGSALLLRAAGARQCLNRLAAALDASSAAAATSAAIAGDYESLLDQVWRCEREWDFDQRLALIPTGLERS